MSVGRHLALLLRLQVEGRVNARALAEHFEVSVRTIYRDIDALSAAGVPVVAERGRHGGFVLQAGYRTRLTGLDRPEAESLFLAGAPYAAEHLGLAAAVETMRLKLLAALPEATAREAQRVGARFHQDPVAWFQGPDEQPLLRQLAAAVWAGRAIEMTYDSWKGVVERRVAPLGLVLKAGTWYFVGAVDGEPRTYRVGSIERLVALDEVAKPPKRFDLARYWREFARDYEARMQSLEARVRVRPGALRALARLSHAVARAALNASPADADGWQHVAIPIESIEVAVGDLMRLGPDVEALGPPALLTALREAVAKLQAVYGGKRERSKKS